MKAKKLFLTICVTTCGFTIHSLDLFAQAPPYLWAIAGTGTGVGNEAYSIATNANGNVFMAGAYSNTITFGSITLSNSNSYYDMFIVKYDALGNALWAKTAGGISNDYAYSVATDTSGNIIVAGHYEGTITFGSITLNTPLSMFIVKYDALGNVLWAKSAETGVGGQSTAYSVATDANGNIIVAGVFREMVKFGSNTLINAYGSSYDMFIVKYDSAGNVLWANSVSTDANDNIFVAGEFGGLITFDSITLTGIGAEDILLLNTIC